MMQLFPSREVAIALGNFEVHWYGIMYLLAFVTVLMLIPRLQHYRGLALSKDTIASIVTWAIAGVIVGGRLGYVLFYEFSYYRTHLLDIFAVWNGGMSSHGGFIGVAITVAYALRKYRIPLLSFLDTAAVPIAIGLAFGRLGNFINLELYGVVTTFPWGIEIPGVEGLRHPTQIYAICKDLSIAFLCYALLTNKRLQPGIVFSSFLILYAVLRFIIEIFRVPSHTTVDLGMTVLTRGQLLSIPLLFIGAALMVWLRQK